MNISIFRNNEHLSMSTEWVKLVNGLSVSEIDNFQTSKYLFFSLSISHTIRSTFLLCIRSQFLLFSNHFRYQFSFRSFVDFDPQLSYQLLIFSRLADYLIHVTLVILIFILILIIIIKVIIILPLLNIILLVSSLSLSFVRQATEQRKCPRCSVVFKVWEMRAPYLPGIKRGMCSLHICVVHFWSMFFFSPSVYSEH